jgi:hypothetical protein
MFVITTKGSDKSLSVETLVTAKALARKFSRQYGRTFTVRPATDEECLEAMEAYHADGTKPVSDAVLMDSPSLLDFHVAAGRTIEHNPYLDDCVIG